MSLKRTAGIAIPIEKDPSKVVVTPEKILPVTYHDQVGDYWCWAACAEMVFEFFGHSSDSQCKMAGDAYGLSCCAPSVPSGCDDEGFVEGCYYKKKGFPFCWAEDQLSYQELIDQLRDDRPIQILWWDSDDKIGHYVLIVGNFDSSSSTDGEFWVFDPLDGKRHLSYNQLRSDPKRGSWRESYSQLNKKPETCLWNASWCS